MSFIKLTIEDADVLQKIANEYYCALKWKHIKEITEMFFGRKAAYIIFDWKVEKNNGVFSNSCLIDGCSLYDSNNHRLTLFDANKTSQLWNDAYAETIEYNKECEPTIEYNKECEPTIEDIVYFAFCLVFGNVQFEQNDAFFQMTFDQKYDLIIPPTVTYSTIYIAEK